MPPQTTATKQQLAEQVPTGNQSLANSLCPEMWFQMEAHHRQNLARHWVRLIQKIRRMDELTRENSHEEI